MTFFACEPAAGPLTETLDRVDFQAITHALRAAGNSPPEPHRLADLARRAQVAQLVEQRTENPRVGGSIPPLGTSLFNHLALFALL